MKRKICVVVTNRASYARIKYVLKAVRDHRDLELLLIAGASLMLSRFGNAIRVMKEDGFEPIRTLYYMVEGETLSTQAKSTGFGVIELSTAFEHLNPDIVITVADRFETMATAIASTYMNIPLAHLQGGEISGNIDEYVRHSITKLAHFHFPSTKKSKARIIKMGELEDNVFNYGCPSIDVLTHADLSISNAVMSKYNVLGNTIDFSKPYIVMLQHPVTTSYGKGREQVEQTLLALKEFSDYQKIVIWPNIDAGTDDVAKGIRIFRESHRTDNFNYFINFTPEDYGRLLNNTVCAVGNSSSFIREESGVDCRPRGYTCALLA